MSLEEFFEEYPTRARDAQGKKELIGLLSAQVEGGISAFTKVGAEAMAGPVTSFCGST